MKKVIVIGCPGSGKSTFSRALAEKTGLPLYCLDMMYWNADRTHVSKEEFRERLDAVLGRDSWIIDGNYASTMEKRLIASDTVIFLDLPREVCVGGITERQGKARADMPWFEAVGEIDREFLEFINKYNSESRPRVLELLNSHPEKSIYIFTDRGQLDGFLETL